MTCSGDFKNLPDNLVMVTTSIIELMMLIGRVYFNPVLKALLFWVNLTNLCLTLSVVFVLLGSNEEAMV